MTCSLAWTGCEDILLGIPWHLVKLPSLDSLLPALARSMHPLVSFPPCHLHSDAENRLTTCQTQALMMQTYIKKKNFVFRAVPVTNPSLSSLLEMRMIACTHHWICLLPPCKNHQWEMGKACFPIVSVAYPSFPFSPIANYALTRHSLYISSHLFGIKFCSN